MTFTIDPYGALGLTKGATTQDIDKAYESLKALLAPAKQANSPGATVQLEQLDTARSILTEHTLRTEFDERCIDTKKDASFLVRVMPSKRVVERLDEEQVVYALLEIIPRTTQSSKPEKEDAGLNLTLVLDHSNSMTGIRLDRVKVAATEIINNLSDQDIISVVGFNDRAEVVIGATAAKEKKVLAAKTRMMRASGGTEMYQGLLAGVMENRKNLRQDRVNHIILLTDGNTYGDQDKCMELAREIAEEGISVSTLGLGSEWNDKFLDEIASITGGSSGFIRSASAVVSFLNNQVQSLSNMFAERMQVSVAAAPGVEVEMAFKLAPSPQPLPESDGLIQLGGMQHERPISLLLQLQIPAELPDPRQLLARTVVTGTMMSTQCVHTVANELYIDVSDNPAYEDPPNKILDALGKLTLYRMQERANEAIDNGNVREATQRLQNLATRLLEVGQEELANEAFTEAKRMERTHMLSEDVRKTLKYQTRHLISQSDD